MTIKTRLAKLEKKNGGGEAIALSWAGESEVTVNGQRMDREEFNRRYPDATVIQLGWADDSPNEADAW